MKCGDNKGNIKHKHIMIMSRNCIVNYAPQSYCQPSLEVVEAYVEAGFELSDSQQEPSPWEDM